MRFICQRDTIQKEIEHAKNFTSQRNSLSIYSNVLLENYQNTLTIKSTDNKLGFSTSFGVITDVPGSVTVTCDKFLEVLKNMPQADLLFDAEDDQISISPSGEKSPLFNLKTIGAEKYPELLTCDEPYFQLSQRDFFDMVQKTSFSVGSDESKFFLTGVYFEKGENGEVVMVSTDGKRLSCSRKHFEQDVPDFRGSIIPTKFLSQLMAVGSGEGVFSIALTQTHIFAEINGHSVYSSLISGNYPAWQRVIPPTFANEAKVPTQALLEALNRVALCVDSDSRKIFMELDHGGILLSSENTEVGSAKAMVNCEYEGPAVSISFNYSFLQAPLRMMETEKLRICFNSPNTAIGVIPEPERDYIFIIMPMH